MRASHRRFLMELVEKASEYSLVARTHAHLAAELNSASEKRALRLSMQRIAILCMLSLSGRLVVGRAELASRV
jgi:hypothetical protein